MFINVLPMIQEHIADSLSTHAAAAQDTFHVAAAHGGGEGNLFAYLLEHIKDSHVLELPFTHVELPHFPPFHFLGMTIDMSITKHVVFLWLSAVILLSLATAAARKNMKSGAPKGLGNLVEVFIVFIRDDVALPNMGPAGVRYLPYLLTTFFFILIMNLMGMIPYGATSTSNVGVTGGLAIIAFFMIQA